MPSMGSQHFSPPKSPAKPFLYWGKSGKRSNSGKATSEKSSLLSIEELYGQDACFAGSQTRIFTIKASPSFQEAIASPKMSFLAGILGVKNVGTPYGCDEKTYGLRNAGMIRMNTAITIAAELTVFALFVSSYSGKDRFKTRSQF